MRLRVLALVLAILAVGLLAVGVARWSDSDDDVQPGAIGRKLSQAVVRATPAEAPFANLTEMKLRVGAQKVRVAVTDDDSERNEGLRRRSDLGPYGGMLFAFSTPTTTSFTMSTVPVPLDIGFYDANGRAVGRLRMEPCAGSDLDCPVYGIDRPFTYALETLAGRLPSGSITPQLS